MYLTLYEHINDTHNQNCKPAQKQRRAWELLRCPTAARVSQRGWSGRKKCYLRLTSRRQKAARLEAVHVHQFRPHGFQLDIFSESMVNLLACRRSAWGSQGIFKVAACLNQRLSVAGRKGKEFGFRRICSNNCTSYLDTNASVPAAKQTTCSSSLHGQTNLLPIFIHCLCCPSHCPSITV